LVFPLAFRNIVGEDSPAEELLSLLFRLYELAWRRTFDSAPFGHLGALSCARLKQIEREMKKS
jgi:hypothetical protein